MLIQLVLFSYVSSLHLQTAPKAQSWDRRSPTGRPARITCPAVIRAKKWTEDGRWGFRLGEGSFKISLNMGVDRLCDTTSFSLFVIPKRWALSNCSGFLSVSPQDCDFPLNTAESHLTAACPVSKATSSSPVMPQSPYDWGAPPDTVPGPVTCLGHQGSSV